MAKELNSADFLRDLAERLRHIPVIHGTDDADISRLYRVAKQLEKAKSCTTQ
jgi:hypothetical protein